MTSGVKVSAGFLGIHFRFPFCPIEFPLDLYQPMSMKLLDGFMEFVSAESKIDVVFSLEHGIWNLCDTCPRHKVHSMKSCRTSSNPHGHPKQSLLVPLVDVRKFCLGVQRAVQHVQAWVSGVAFEMSGAQPCKASTLCPDRPSCSRLTIKISRSGLSWVTYSEAET